ncbi:hypothetical protein DQW77_16100 [Roseovarius sp. TE539]|nr:hypothetical protein DQW77_16100 [Roseovarius sp. TE539]
MPSLMQRLRASSLVRSTLALLATRGLSILIGVALSVLLARWLAPEAYGAYLFTLTIAQFLAMPILAGLPTLVVREVATTRSSGDAEGLAGILRWSAGFILATFLVVTGLAAAFLLLWEGGEGTMSIHVLALPLVLALAFLRMGSALVQGYEHPFFGNLGDGLIRPALLLGLVSLAAVSGILSPEAALWLHVSSATATAGLVFGYWLLVCRERVAVQRSRPRYETRKWLSSLVPLALITAASLLNSRLDILMVGLLTAAEDVAHYGIAMQIVGIVMLGRTIVNSIVAPKIARLYGQNDHTGLRRMITSAARISTATALVLFLVILLFGDQIIAALLGEDYAAVWPIALILCGGSLVSSAMGPVGNLLNMTGHERTTARFVWLSALVNGLMNLLLVQLYGALGAAIATALTQVLYHFILVFWISTRLKIDTTIIGRNLLEP